MRTSKGTFRPDARMFVWIGEMWISHRTYKTKRGAQEFIDRLNRKNTGPYVIVEGTEYSYRPILSGPVVYRVAVKEDGR